MNDSSFISTLKGFPVNILVQSRIKYEPSISAVDNPGNRNAG